ncbi:hypothetical protein N7G274_007571 [Stereocaulon virgatum]|uniref:Uncharacterized protein n=1 Tax=Stereocaulon virgatum TaxID=373712 RepID=A0ABR4A188_9LECA
MAVETLQIHPDLGLALVSSPSQVKLDVVFVHGLGGSRSSTWTNKNEEFWPAWLGDTVPNARIWTYGYNSSFWKTPSEDALELHNAQFWKNVSVAVWVCRVLR